MKGGVAMEHQSIWATIHKAWGIKGHKYLLKLMEQSQDMDFWSMPAEILKKRYPFLTEEMVTQYMCLRDKTALEQVAYLDKHRIKVIGFYDQQYPEMLRHIYNPPAILYCKGSLAKANLSIAMVGSRRCTPYGRQVSAQIAEQLSLNNVQVISGLLTRPVI